MIDALRAVALGEGDDLGAVLCRDMPTRQLLLLLAPPARRARPGATPLVLADALEARWDANETESNPLANGKMNWLAERR